jgi:hypothetical protein
MVAGERTDNGLEAVEAASRAVSTSNLVVSAMLPDGSTAGSGLRATEVGAEAGGPGAAALTPAADAPYGIAFAGSLSDDIPVEITLG